MPKKYNKDKLPEVLKIEDRIIFSMGDGHDYDGDVRLHDGKIVYINMSQGSNNLLFDRRGVEFTNNEEIELFAAKICGCDMEVNAGGWPQSKGTNEEKLVNLTKLVNVMMDGEKYRQAVKDFRDNIIKEKDEKMKTLTPENKDLVLFFRENKEAFGDNSKDVINLVSEMTKIPIKVLI